MNSLPSKYIIHMAILDFNQSFNIVILLQKFVEIFIKSTASFDL